MNPKIAAINLNFIKNLHRISERNFAFNIAGGMPI